MLNNGINKGNDDDGENSENDGGNDQADGVIEDIRPSVHYVMDLIPSMEQVLQQTSANMSMPLKAISAPRDC